MILLALSLAIFRITRLITDDTIFDHQRIWVVTRLTALHRPIFDKIAYMVTCPWCMSFWVALAVFGLTWAFVSIPLPGLVFFAAWGGAMVVRAFAEK